MVKVLFSRQRALQKKVKMHQAIEFLAVQPTRVIYNFTGFCPFIINIKNLKKITTRRLNHRYLQVFKLYGDFFPNQQIAYHESASLSH